MTVGGGPTRRGEPAHLVLDSEGLSQLGSQRPSRALIVALEAAAATAGRVVLPTSVMVEQRHDRTVPSAANANRRLRTARPDPLDVDRAAGAVRLVAATGPGPSVVDAHVAACALAVIRQRGGTAVVATSDPADLQMLVSAERDGDVRSRTTIHPL